jgi:hypothetical protein
MKPIAPPIFQDSMKVCASNYQLLEPGYDHYLWSTGDTTNFTNIHTKGIYWLQYRKNNQCNNIDSTFIQIWSTPQMYIGNDTLLCNEASLQLHASTIDADSIEWLDLAKGQFSNKYDSNTVLTFTNKPLGNIRVIGMAKNYCGETSDTLNVNLVNRISATFTPLDTMVCEKSSAFYLHPQVSGGVFEGEHIIGIAEQEHNRGRQLIEEFMIATNGSTARFLLKKGIPSLRRVVRSPDRWLRIVELAKQYGEVLPNEANSKALSEF